MSESTSSKRKKELATIEVLALVKSLRQELEDVTDKLAVRDAQLECARQQAEQGRVSGIEAARAKSALELMVSAQDERDQKMKGVLDEAAKAIDALEIEREKVAVLEASALEASCAPEDPRIEQLRKKLTTMESKFESLKTRFEASKTANNELKLKNAELRKKNSESRSSKISTTVPPPEPTKAILLESSSNIREMNLKRNEDEVKRRMRDVKKIEDALAVRENVIRKREAAFKAKKIDDLRSQFGKAESLKKREDAVEKRERRTGDSGDSTVPWIREELESIIRRLDGKHPRDLVLVSEQRKRRHIEVLSEKADSTMDVDSDDESSESNLRVIETTPKTKFALPPKPVDVFNFEESSTEVNSSESESDSDSCMNDLAFELPPKLPETLVDDTPLVPSIDSDLVDSSLKQIFSDIEQCSTTVLDKNVLMSIVDSIVEKQLLDVFLDQAFMKCFRESLSLKSRGSIMSVTSILATKYPQRSPVTVFIYEILLSYSERVIGLPDCLNLLKLLLHDSPTPLFFAPLFKTFFPNLDTIEGEKLEVPGLIAMLVEQLLHVGGEEWSRALHCGVLLSLRTGKVDSPWIHQRVLSQLRLDHADELLAGSLIAKSIGGDTEQKFRGKADELPKSCSGMAYKALKVMKLV